jgi:hypothetical protein
MLNLSRICLIYFSSIGRYLIYPVGNDVADVELLYGSGVSAIIELEDYLEELADALVLLLVSSSSI